jgi:aldehyde:ferredoxin oxidoreductase
MYGYAGSILVCDLSRQETTRMPTSDYARIFLGGRGLAARLYWEQEVLGISALEPENLLTIATGPLAGFTGLSGSRWQICAKSPSIASQSFSYSTLGGSWGAQLKFAGFDALLIRGVSNKPTHLFIHDGACEFRDASHLWGQGAAQTRENLKAELGQDVRVLATGPAGENLVSFASLLADNDASASCGFGAVMGSKKLKAVTVFGTNRPEPADPTKLRQLTDWLREVKQRRLPQTPSPPKGMRARRQACFGCIAGCERSLLEMANGKRGKYLCGSGLFYEPLASRYYGELNEIPFLATRLCDDYGLDANVIEAMIVWLSRCHIAGILSDQETGLPLSQRGSLEFIEGLVRKIALREGFGDILAQGTLKAAQTLGSDFEKLLGDYVFHDGTGIVYCPRMYVTNALIFALEPRQDFPQTGDVGGTIWRWLDWVNGVENPEVTGDDIKFIAHYFWGSEEAGDFSTYRGKALAAKMIQDRHAVKESAILCNFSWHISAIELFRPGVIVEVLSAVTGVEHDKNSIYQLGERVFNLQRAIHVRERGYGREGDTLPEVWYTTPLKEAFMNPELLAPGPGGQPITRRDAVMDRHQFELIKDEYYRLRQWDVATGLQTESKLAALGLADVARDLRRVNLSH